MTQFEAALRYHIETEEFDLRFPGGWVRGSGGDPTWLPEPEYRTECIRFAAGVRSRLARELGVPLDMEEIRRVGRMSYAQQKRELEALTKKS